MSLIEEALRRAQQDRPPASPPKRQQPLPRSEPSSTSEPVSLIGEATKAALPPPAPSAPASSPWTDSALTWLRLGLVGTGVVAMAFWTYRVVFSSRHAVVSVPSPPATQVAAVVEPPPLEPPPPPEPVYTLNGIVQGVGSEPFAVINDTIVQLGETVDGATLISVDSGIAKLRRDTKEIVLKTSK